MRQTGLDIGPGRTAGLGYPDIAVIGSDIDDIGIDAGDVNRGNRAVGQCSGSGAVGQIAADGSP